MFRANYYSRVTVPHDARSFIMSRNCDFDSNFVSVKVEFIFSLLCQSFYVFSLNLKMLLKLLGSVRSAFLEGYNSVGLALYPFVVISFHPCHGMPSLYHNGAFLPDVSYSRQSLTHGHESLRLA